MIPYIPFVEGKINLLFGSSLCLYEIADTEREEAYNPGHYAYGAQNSYTPAPKKPKKKRGFLKAVCLVLVCIIAAGSASWLVMDYMLDKYDEELEEKLEDAGTQVVIGNAGVSDSSKDENPTYTGNSMTAGDIYTMATQQVVGVNTELTSTNIFGQTTSSAVSGSGFIISADGYILTNYHVISYAANYGGELTVFMYDGTSYEAEIIGYVEDNDVAVIKIDAQDLNAVSLGNSDKMSVGDAVYAVGNPLGELTYTLTDGIVSALDRVITTSDETTGLTTSMNMFQTNAAVNSGNSGGPMYNAYGEVIGIVTAKYSESGVEGLSFAIPINDAVALAAQLIEKGYVSGAVLGVEVLDVTSVYSSLAIQYYGYPSDGVCIMTVNSGSAAEKAGIIKGDIIIALDGKDIASTDELKMALRKYNPGDEAVVTVYRPGQTLGEGENIELSVVFDEKTQAAEEQEEDPRDQQPGYGSHYPGGYGGFFPGFGG